jgi:hypothetical protein
VDEVALEQVFSEFHTHTHISLLHGVCDSPAQSAYNHTRGPKLGASFLVGLGVKVIL